MPVYLRNFYYKKLVDTRKKENEEMEGVHNNSGPGKIVFNYGVSVPFSISGFDKLPETGDIIIFPAWLTHYAHAFKSDVERISVSGNVVLNYDLLE